jgi:hypothetical protein
MTQFPILWDALLTLRVTKFVARGRTLLVAMPPAWHFSSIP